MYCMFICLLIRVFFRMLIWAACAASLGGKTDPFILLAEEHKQVADHGCRRFHADWAYRRAPRLTARAFDDKRATALSRLAHFADRATTCPAFVLPAEGVMVFHLHPSSSSVTVQTVHARMRKP